MIWDSGTRECGSVCMHAINVQICHTRDLLNILIRTGQYEVQMFGAKALRSATEVDA